MDLLRREQVRPPFFKEWLIRPSNPEARRALADALGFHLITAAVLADRGVLSHEQAAAVLLAEWTVRAEIALC